MPLTATANLQQLSRAILDGVSARIVEVEDGQLRIKNVAWMMLYTHPCAQTRLFNPVGTDALFDLTCGLVKTYRQGDVAVGYRWRDYSLSILSDEDRGTKVRNWPAGKQQPVMTHGTGSKKAKDARRKARKNKQ